jgi:hypothetical protein
MDIQKNERSNANGEEERRAQIRRVPVVREE